MEGLFRVPGNSVRQQALRELLNSGADVDLQGGDFHANDVASLLKSFLGELPEPLLTHRHFTAHLKIAGENKPWFWSVLHCFCLLGPSEPAVKKAFLW